MRIGSAAEAPAKVAKAIRTMHEGRPGPAALECAIDVWGKRGAVLPIPAPRRSAAPRSTKTRCAPRLSFSATPSDVLIVAGGGAQDASAEVTLLSDMLQAPVMAYRRGRGVLDARSPFSVTLPIGYDLWKEADADPRRRHQAHPMTAWGIDNKLAVVRVDADAEEPERYRKPAVALIGDAAPILRATDRQARPRQQPTAIPAARKCRSGRRNCANASPS